MEEQKKTVGGRPKKNDSERKDCKTNVRFTKYEHEKLCEQAKKANMKLPELIRLLVVKGKVVPKYSEEEKQIIRNVATLNNNLNQIAKNLNYFVKNFNMKEVSKQVVRIDDLLNQIDVFLK